MKIVRKSSAQATTSSTLENGHGPPVPKAPHSRDRRYAEPTQTDGTKSADFSHMSRHELHELINCQTRSGQLSLEGSATLTWLSVNLPVARDQSMQPSEHEIVNFQDGAQTGRDAALSDDNALVARQYEIAMDLMHRIQGQTIGVDTLV